MRFLAIAFSICAATTTLCQSPASPEASSKTLWSLPNAPKTWLQAPRGSFALPSDSNAWAARKFVFDPKVTPTLVAHNDENGAMSVAKGQPIPTEWPNLKKESIPTDWPMLKKLPVNDPPMTHAK